MAQEPKKTTTAIAPTGQFNNCPSLTEQGFQTKETTKYTPLVVGINQLVDALKTGGGDFFSVLQHTTDTGVLEEAKAIIQSRRIKKADKEQYLSAIDSQLERASFIPFSETLRGYGACYQMTPQGIVINITTPEGGSDPHQTTEFKLYLAQRIFARLVNQWNPPPITEVEDIPKPSLPPPELSEKEKRIVFLKNFFDLLTPGQEVICQGRKGIFTGKQDTASPDAWVEIDGLVQGINPSQITMSNWLGFAVGGHYIDTLHGQRVTLKEIKFYIPEQTFLPLVAVENQTPYFLSWEQLTPIPAGQIEILPDVDNSAPEPPDISDLSQNCQDIIKVLGTKSLLDLEVAIRLDRSLYSLRKDFDHLLKEGIVTKDGEDVYALAIEIGGQEAEQVETRNFASVHEQLIASLPSLPPSAPTAVIFFGGGGGIEAGMVEAGIRPVISVECDPTKPELSSAIADCHEENFSQYGCQVIRSTIQEIAAAGFPGIPRNPMFLHASPVCTNFSDAKTNGAETGSDIESATATAQGIRELSPWVFTLEQVPGYEKSQSLKIIHAVLNECGYGWKQEVLNLAEYGDTPTCRQRLVLRAVHPSFANPPFPLPPITPRTSWYAAIKDLIPSMEDSELVAGQKVAVEEFLQDNTPVPLLLPRVGIRDKEYKVRESHLPALTLTRSIFTDDNGNNRSRFIDIWLPDGTTKNLSLRGAARIQGFPDWYKLPEEPKVAGAVIGNSVPPSFAKVLFQQALSWLEAEDNLVTDQEKIPVPTWAQEKAGETGEAINLKVPSALPCPSASPTPLLSSSTLSLEQSQQIIEAIKYSLTELGRLEEEITYKSNNLRVYINMLDVGHGYKALGYKDMTDLFKSGILGNHSRSKLSREWQSARVERHLGLDVGTIPQDYGQKLAPLLRYPELLTTVYAGLKDKPWDKDLLTAITERVSAQVNKPIKALTASNRTGWVSEQGSRYYRLNLGGYERNFHDTYQNTFTQLEQLSQAKKQPVEQIAIAGLLKLVCDSTGLSEQAAIAAGIEALAKQ